MAGLSTRLIMSSYGYIADAGTDASTGGAG